MHDALFLALAFVFGAAFGSFLNVLIYRLPRDISIIKPGSHCPDCKKPIRPYDNIPVISYLILRGKCRHCGARISPRYMLVEVLSGLLVLFSLYYFGMNVGGFEAAFLSLVFIAVFFIDLDFRIIPDFFTLPGIAIGLAVSLVPGAFVNWVDALIGIAVGGGVFYLIGKLGELLFKKEAMGFGDVKFAAMLGAFLGWPNLLLIFVLASFLGSVIGLSIIFFFARGKGRSTYVPFGPFLVVAATIAIYFGNRIIAAYMNFIRG
jgi:leader peptidase (prepilin peptidase)/N-methyltransferase